MQGRVRSFATSLEFERTSRNLGSPRKAARCHSLFTLWLCQYQAWIKEEGEANGLRYQTVARDLSLWNKPPWGSERRSACYPIHIGVLDAANVPPSVLCSQLVIWKTWTYRAHCLRVPNFPPTGSDHFRVFDVFHTPHRDVYFHCDFCRLSDAFLV